MSRSFSPVFSILITIAFFISSCNSNEIGNSKDVNPEAIWFDYSVWSEEDNDEVTVKLQYRFAGPNGTTLVLEEPSKVELDGEIVTADSSKMTGAFYEVRKPVATFTGKHSIVFTDINNKQYKEEFRFQPMRLLTTLPETIQRGDIQLELDGLEPVDYVKVLMTDTSFGTEGVTRVDTVRNGKLLISRAALAGLVSGPIHLELIREEERRVKNGTAEGGRILISCGLRREFILQ